MLSYIHAYHAGNYGDILKHLVFKFTLEHLLKKDKAFTIIDSHSGSGVYKINDERLIKTGEAEKGIKKLLSSDEKDLRDILGDSYLVFLQDYLSKGLYPGSPETARFFMRSCDHLILNELHPAVSLELKENMKQPLASQKKEIPQILIKNLDAAAFLKSTLPPAVKRGCVIIDPSYEDADDYLKTTEMFLDAYRKWSTPTYLIWYPLLTHRQDEIERMKQTVIAAVEKNNNTEDEKAVFYEIKIKQPHECEGLSKMYGSGMLAVNPPYGLEEKMQEAVPFLEKVLKEK
jgi:23S rRNA (adenine2030-N6)-methyltransferase